MKPLRDVFGEALRELGRSNSDVFVLDADLAGATRSAFFGSEFPDRFFNVGITEANMVCIASGLAGSGKIPFACTFSFLICLRAADQVRSLVCYPRMNVKLVGTNAGLSGFGDGATHQCVMDLALMRAMPEMTVLVPSDDSSVRQAVFQAAEIDGPVYIRIPRVEAPSLKEQHRNWKIGKGILLRDGGDITIAATGLMVHQAVEAAELLAAKGISAQVLEIHTLKPLDCDLIQKCITETGAAVVVEEHSRYGGLGSAVAEVMAERHPAPLEYVAIPDRFGESGQYEEILASCGLTVEKIVEKAESLLIRKKSLK